MQRWGFWIALFGLLYWVLPEFGVEHIAFRWLGDAAAPVAGAMVAVGLILFVAGWFRRTRTTGP